MIMSSGMMRLLNPENDSKEFLSSKLKVESWLYVKLREKYKDTRPLWGDPRPLSKGWTPSSLAEPNDRMLVAYQLGYRGDKISDKLQRIFDAGNDIESRWIKRFKDLDLYIDSGKWIPSNSSSGLTLRGIVDIIIHHPYEKDRQIIVEVKSISPIGFQQLPPASPDANVNFQRLMSLPGDIGSRCKRYMYQLQVYLRELGVSDGMLLFDNKGNQDFKDFAISANPSILDEMYDRLKDMQERYWSKDLLPPWNKRKGKSIFSTYRPDEAVPVEEIKQLMLETYKEE